MTTREKLIRDVLDLPESEIEPVAEFIASRGTSGTDPEAAMPGDTIDDWGNLSAMTRASSRRALKRMSDEEAAAGFSWEDHLPA